jgi:hypothetical protein
MREGIWRFTFKADLTDQNVYAIAYRSLDEANEKLAAGHGAVVALAHVAPKIKVAHARAERPGQAKSTP